MVWHFMIVGVIARVWHYPETTRGQLKRRRHSLFPLDAAIGVTRTAVAASYFEFSIAIVIKDFSFTLLKN